MLPKETFILRGEHLRFLEAYLKGAQDAMRQSAAYGYGDAFADAEQKFYGRLCSDEENGLIIVIGRTDSICDLCKAFSNRYCIDCDDPRSYIAEKDRSELASRNLTPRLYELRQLTLLLNK